MAIIYGKALAAGGASSSDSTRINVNIDSGTIVNAIQDSTVVKSTSIDGRATLEVGSGSWRIYPSGTKFSPSNTTVNTVQILQFGSSLNSYTWEEISEISHKGLGADYFSIGDCKSVYLNGTAGGTTFNTTLWVYIIGFDHNSELEGEGIAFQGFKTAQTGGTNIALVSSYGSSGTGFCINTSHTSSGGWVGSYAYNTLMPQIKAILPSALQQVIRTTILYTDNVGGGSGNVSTNINNNSNTLYFLSEFEVFGDTTFANSYEASYQQQYEYYEAGYSSLRKKYKHNSTSTACTWWVRSPAEGYSGNFCSVSERGSNSADASYYSYGIAPAFKV